MNALRRLPAEAWLLLWPLAVLAWRATLDVEVFSLSEDDFSRTLDGWRVAHGTLFPTDVWPPGAAWLVGLLLAFGAPLHAAPALVNLAAITAAVVLASDAARRLGAPAPARLLAAAIVLGSRWPAWLGLSALAEPPGALGFALVVHGLIRRQTGDRGARTEVIAGAALAALCRYEAWAVAVGAAVALAVDAAEASRLRRAAGAAAALAVPLAWTALEWAWNRDVSFLLHSREMLSANPGSARGVDYLSGLVFDLLQGCGPALVLAALGAWATREDRRLRPILALWGGTAIAYLLAGALGFAGAHNPARVWLGHALVLPIFAAPYLARWSRERRIGAGIVAAAACLPFWAPVPGGYDTDTARIAARTRGELAAAPGLRVMVEAVPWACVAVDGLIGAPELVSWDRIPDGTPLSPTHLSELGGDVDTVRAALRARGIGFVVTGSLDHVRTLAELADDLERDGRWTLWRVRRQ